MSDDKQQTTMSQAPNSAETNPETRRAWWVYVVWVGVAALLLYLGWGLLNANETRPEVDRQAPDFPMTFYDGYEWDAYQAANLSDMEGKVVLLNFWASWCGPCEDEADVLENAWRAYRDDDVVFVGVAYSDIDRDALEFLERYGITYPNAPDMQLRASDAYRITGVPETFFIDRDGSIAYVQPGPLTTAQLDSIMQGILNN